MTIGSLLLVGCGGGGGGGSSSNNNTGGGSGGGGGGTTEEVLRFSVNKDAIDFGSTVVGQTVPGSMTVTNTGNTTLNVQATLSGDSAFGSLDVPAACGNLAANAECVINVAFAPAAEGDFTGTLSLSATGATGRSVALAGRGQELNVQITSVGQSCDNPLAATVSVTDSDGLPVLNLLQQYFSAFLSESATASDVLSWSQVDANARKPFALMLAVDWSGSTEAIRSSIIDATDRFVDVLQPNDKVGLIRFAREVEETSLLVLADDTGKQQIKDAVRTDFPFGSASSRVWDAVQAARRIVDGESEDDYTRVVILLTDGVDTGSQAALDDVTARAQAANTLVYTVGFEGSQGFNLEDLRELSDATGALAFQSTNASDLEQFYNSITESLNGLYELTIDNPSAAATSLRVVVDTASQTGDDSRPVSACP